MSAARAHIPEIMSFTRRSQPIKPELVEFSNENKPSRSTHRMNFLLLMVVLAAGALLLGLVQRGPEAGLVVSTPTHAAPNSAMYEWLGFHRVAPMRHNPRTFQDNN